MFEIIFIAAIAVFFIFVYYLGFKYLPGERWQVLACIPWGRSETGDWQGLNFTYYGVFNAFAYLAGMLAVFTLLGAAGIPLAGILAMAFIILGVCIPAATLVARAVEGKRYTFSVGGASFVGIVLSPWAIIGTDRLLGESLGSPVPFYPALAAFAIAYALGEGSGRLACISYGCCYGKPLSSCGPLVRRLFRNHCFVFSGSNKKIAYASRLEGIEVVPIQAVTSVIFTSAALVAMVFFLGGWFFAAYLLPLAVTQIWRFLSEFLRADYRGGHSISPYQVLSLMALVYASALFFVLPPEPTVVVDIAGGIRSLWDPAVILILEAVALITFFHTGRSNITASSIRLHLNEDRI